MEDGECVVGGISTDELGRRVSKLGNTYTILTHLVKERNAHESFRDLFDNWDARQHGEEFRRRIHEAGERTHCEDEVGADKRR